MVRVGVVGIGFMGWIHWLAYHKVTGIQVTAVCTRDPKKLAGDWRGIKGNFGPPGEQVDLTGIHTFREVEQLLADPEVDVIDICLPPHLHADVACQAFAAGKHVFCEKPMALTAEDCDRMVEAAGRANRQLLIGQVVPYFPEYTYVLDAARSHEFGRVLGGHFKRVISDPTWIPDFYDPQRVGGPLVDLHVHDAHFIRLLYGMPQEVVSRGRMRGDVVQYVASVFGFEDPQLVVSALSGVIDQQGRAFTQGFEVHFERATLQYELAVVGDRGELLMPLTVFDSDGKVTRPEMSAGDPLTAFYHEVEEVRRCVADNQPSPTLSGGHARDAIVLCHRQTESVTSRQPVRV